MPGESEKKAGGFPEWRDIAFVSGIALGIALLVSHGPELARKARERFTKSAG